MTDRDYLTAAYVCAALSPDPSTQNGAILFNHGEVTGGYNFPMLPTGELWPAPDKYLVMQHAERAALFSAVGDSRNGVLGGTLYACWAACSDCAIAIVELGVEKLVRHVRPEIQTWQKSIEVGTRIMLDAGVEIIDIEGPIPGAPPVRFKGKLVYPGGGA